MPPGASRGDRPWLTRVRAGCDLSTWTEYPYGCGRAAPVGRLSRMTTHRAPKPLADPNRPVERAVTAALVLAVLAGLGWIGGMIYTVAGWSM